jgi:hypothetical protein
MLSRVPETSLCALRTDKVRAALACGSRPQNPDVALRTSPLCDVLWRPTGEATRNGNLIN